MTEVKIVSYYIFFFTPRDFHYQKSKIDLIYIYLFFFFSFDLLKFDGAFFLIYWGFNRIKFLFCLCY